MQENESKDEVEMTDADVYNSFISYKAKYCVI